MSAKKAKKSDIKLERPPVVAVLGHVDHGKTSLLDVIRGTSVQEGEAGGITQSVRAHKVETKNGNSITFIDTPGHEAFSDMRSRGASVTDIVLLVVAADDSVQPQTKESIKYAKKAGVPIIVAVNKMDLPGASADKVKKDLSQNDVLVEEYGGEVIIIPVSAKKEEGIDELLENILLLAEIGELKNEEPKEAKAEAVVLESQKDSKLGSITLALIKKGTLTPDDFVSYSGGHSKLRALLDENFKSMEAAFPSDPVWLSGISEVLDTGMKLSFYETEKKAKENSQEKEVIVKDIEVEEQADSAEKPDYDTALLAELLVDEKEEDDKKKLNVIIRTDTQGTVDAVESELAKLNDADVEVTIVDKGTGQITEGDIYKAKTVKAIVLGFRVDYPKDVEAIAKREKVLVRRYEIIYEMVEEVDAALTGLLEPEQEEVEVARAKVKQVFELTNGDVVAGCEVIKGRVLRGYRVYVDREGERVADGKITSLKRNKDEVKEVDKGLDCGILIEPKAVIEVGDEIVAYKVERV